MFAAEASQRAYSAQQRVNAAQTDVDDLRRYATEEEQPGYLVGRYRDSYRDLVSAKRAHADVREPAKAALVGRDYRRGQAQSMLKETGMPLVEANAFLDSIDRDTGFSPPF